MNVQLNVSYYDNKQDHSNLNMLMHTHIYPIYLYDWTLNDLAYCHSNTHLTEQSLLLAGCPPCNALSYHRVREAIAANVLKFHHISGKENPADVLTKFLPSAVW